MKIVVAIVCILLAGTNVHAQWHDSLPLKEVDIKSTRFNNFNIGQKTATIDSLQMLLSQNHNLSDVLAEQSQVFVKNYGPGNIATASFRGTGAEHTAVLWNGFNMQSPMLGLVDLSIIPFSSGDEVTFKYGGNGALYGSGVIGGAIHLNTKADFNSSVHASVGIFVGSFQTNKQLANVSYGNQNWYGNIKLLNVVAENNFTFHNTSLSGNPEQKQTHANSNQHSVIIDNIFKIASNQELGIHFWVQQSDRQIPPTMSVPTSTASQMDQSMRTTADWKIQTNQTTMVARTALFNETLNYTDVPKNISSLNKVNTHITEVEYTHETVHHVVYSFGLNNTFNAATSESYTDKRTNRFAQFVSMKAFIPKTKIMVNASLRAELMNKQWLPIIPSFGFSWNFNPSWKIYGNISRSYRVPTFNEMYWNPGGNPLLKPEESWGQEISTYFQTHGKKLNFDLTFTLFNRHINNWILWVSDSSIWTPKNVQQVWNRGIETSIHFKYQINKNWQVRIQSALNFIQSTIANAGNDQGNQLPYLPRITQQYQASLIYKAVFLSYAHTYTGMRYASSDNTVVMDDYQLGNVKAGVTLKLLKTQCIIQAEANNIWNVSYQVMPDRPLPLRNFLIGLTLKI